MNKMEKRYVAAIDIGTSSTKAALVDRESRIVGAAAVEYPLLTPSPDRAEQDPDKIVDAVVSAIREAVNRSGADAGEILCVSFSAAMHSLIAVDETNKPITPCITWADNRSADYEKILHEQFDGKSIYMNTGTPIHPMAPLLKIMWLRDNEPEIFKRTAKFIGIKEYLIAKMCGRFVIDYSLASATGMFNLNGLKWDKQALEAASISEKRLSEPVPPSYVISDIDTKYLSEMGLQAATPFVVGASDGVLANLGIGATAPGEFAVTIGTSGAVRTTVDRPITDPLERLFCYALTPRQWVIGGPINNGGVLLRWVRDELATLEAEEARKAGKDPYEYLTELAAEIEPGSNGLLVIPLFMGERAPYWNANARGVFFGLTLYHRKAHMIRAVMEGVGFSLHSVAEALRELAGPPKRILASGGFARSPLWCQIIADILGTPLSVPKLHDSSAIGAAIMGFAAMEGIDGPLALTSQTEETSYLPDMQKHALYQRLSKLYRKVYEQLETSFDDIADFQKQN